MLIGLREPNGSSERLALATFPDGPTEDVALPEGFAAPKGRTVLWQSHEEPIAPDESEVLLLLGAMGGSQGITTYRPGEPRPGPLIEGFRFLGRLDRDTVLATSNRDGGLERVNLRTGARTPVRPHDAR